MSDVYGEDNVVLVCGETMPDAVTIREGSRCFAATEPVTDSTNIGDVMKSCEARVMAALADRKIGLALIERRVSDVNFSDARLAQVSGTEVSSGRVEMSEWQPINTAPRDGTLIDIWATGRCPDCFWEECDGEDFMLSGWRQRYAESPGNSFSIDDLEPTHWMPLPQPPST